MLPRKQRRARENVLARIGIASTIAFGDTGAASRIVTSPPLPRKHASRLQPKVTFSSSMELSKTSATATRIVPPGQDEWQRLIPSVYFLFSHHPRDLLDLVKKVRSRRQSKPARLLACP